MMKDSEDLHQLACTYRDKARDSGHWADYLKAHGLANCCVAKEPTDDARRLVYDIENQWYEGNFALSFTQHEVLTTEHKKLVRQIRKNTRHTISGLKGREQQSFDVDDILSESNLSKGSQFACDVFKMSENCSEELIRVSKSIIESSIQILSSSGLHPPCSFAVIALGSIARGQATPYSDLEYAFIVENNAGHDYFKKLALDSYFRIGNLGETPWRSFNITEIRDDYSSWEHILSGLPEGYRIDGISDRAGNIPTGNPGGQSLTLTQSEFVKLYKTLLSSNVTQLSDKADLLSNTVLIYYNEGGELIYDETTKALAAEFQQARSEQSIIRKRLRLIDVDLKKYDFLPRTKSFGPPDNSNLKVKTDIFRYPTLLADHLKLALGLDSCYPWDVHSDLHNLGLLSDTNFRYMNIILGISIYIRTSAYLALGTQSDRLSLYTYSAVSPLYHVPRNVFVVLGVLLTPIKLQLESNLKRLLANEDCLDMGVVLRNLLNNIEVPTSDLMLQAEVLYFTGDYDGALNLLYAATGKDSVNNMSTEDLIHHLNVRPTDMKLMEMCCYLLWSAGEFEYAVRYLDWLTEHEHSDLGVARWKVLTAECLNKCHSYKTSVILLQDVIKWLRSKYILKAGDSIPKHVLNTYTDHCDLTQDQLDLLELTVHAYRIVGDTCLCLKFYAHGEEITQICIKMCESLLYMLPGRGKLKSSLMNSLGKLFSDIGEFDDALECYAKSLELRKTVHGKNTYHPDLAECYSNFGNLYKLTGKFQKAFESHESALEILKQIHGGSLKHMDIAICYSSIGDVQMEMGFYIASLKSHCLSLSIKHEIYGADNADIASCYISIGQVLFMLQQYKQSADYQAMAFRILINLRFGNTCHPGLSGPLAEIGRVYTAMGESEKALVSHEISLNVMRAVQEETRSEILAISMVYSDMKGFTESLAMGNKLLNTRKLKHGRYANHPDIANSYNNIGYVYNQMGEYTKAVEYFNKSLNTQKEFYGDNGNHPSTALIYNNIGSVYTDMGEYTKAMAYHTKGLDIDKAVYGRDANHPSIAANYNNIGLVYGSLGEYTKALEYYTKGLKMWKAVCGSCASHPSIAISYSNIGLVHDNLGDYTKALEYYNKCLGMRKVIYRNDTNHPSMATIYNNIGRAYKTAGVFLKALDYYTKCLDIEKALYGSDSVHPSIAISYNNIGSVYNDTGEYTKALEYHTKGLDILKAVYGGGTNHPSVAISYNNIALVYSSLGEHPKALEYYAKSLDIRMSVRGSDTNLSSIATIYNNMGSAHRATGDYTKALDYHMKCLDISKDVYGSDINHPFIATTYNNIGLVYDSLQEYTKALEFYAKSLDLRMSIYGNDTKCLPMAIIYNNIGSVHRATGNYTTALEYYTKCLDIDIAIYGVDTNHPSVATTCFNVGYVCYKMEEYAKALQHFTRYLNMQQAAYGSTSNHPNINAAHRCIQETKKRMSQISDSSPTN